MPHGMTLLLIEPVTLACGFFIARLIDDLDNSRELLVGRWHCFIEVDQHVKSTSFSPGGAIIAQNDWRHTGQLIACPAMRHEAGRRESPEQFIEPIGQRSIRNQNERSQPLLHRFCAEAACNQQSIGRARREIDLCHQSFGPGYCCWARATRNCVNNGTGRPVDPLS